MLEVGQSQHKLAWRFCAVVRWNSCGVWKELISVKRHLLRLKGDAFILILKLHLFIYCVWVGTCHALMPWCVFGGQRATFRILSSPPPMWGPRTQVSRLGGMHLYPWSHLDGPGSVILNLCKAHNSPLKSVVLWRKEANTNRECPAHQATQRTPSTLEEEEDRGRWTAASQLSGE